VDKKPITVYCHCAYYQIIPDGTKRDVLDGLKASGAEFTAVPDLCRLRADRDPRLERWANAESLRIFACYPRTVKWLFHAAGISLPDQGVEFVNMRTADPEELVASLLAGQTPAQPQKDINLKKEGDWIPWFPVIDYDRCVNCKQCLNFCLFGVFELNEDDKVQVSNPANCKTNCPACAKACPQTAIIFPKFGESPINGDDVPEQSPKEEEAKAKLGDLLSGDIYDTIRSRDKGAKRFSADPDPIEDPAMRQGCPTLDKLQKDLGIPPEVLASLSPKDMAQIREKAAAQTDPDDSPKAERQAHD